MGHRWVSTFIKFCPKDFYSFLALGAGARVFFLLPSLIVVRRITAAAAVNRIVALQPRPGGTLIRYVNRLSDLLFVLARAVNKRSAKAETEW